VSKSSTPRGMNLGKLIEEYGSEEKCRAFLEVLRWPDGPMCPKCDEKSVSRIATRNLYECNSCRYQFSVRTGTVLQDSKLALWKWFMATFLMTESKKGISANQIRRMIGSTYRTSWFLTHRIREAMRMVERPKLSGTVEVDETYIGGKPRYRSRKRGYSPTPKTIVIGAVERGGDVHLRMERHPVGTSSTARFVRQHIDPRAPKIYSDSSAAYPDFSDDDTKHERVNHRELEWVRGDVHTNTVESVWSLFKRSIVGSYHHLSTKHMDSYLDEFEWRFNNRFNDRLFRDTLRALMRSETMTYKKLIERPA